MNSERISNWTAYHIEPLQPLVFRSGRPFGSSAQSDGANFPLPSSAAGLLRTLHAQAHNGGLHHYDSAVLRRLGCKGPVVLRAAAREAEQGRWSVCVPQPADAVYVADTTRDGSDGSSAVRAVRLAPMPLPAGVACDLPDGLIPVQWQDNVRAKPRPGPRWWTLSQWEQWQCGQPVRFTDDAQEEEPLVSPQVHVALDDYTRAARDGQLYRVDALDFGASLGQAGRHHPTWSFGVFSEAQVPAQVAVFGGEGRLSAVRPHDGWAEPLQRVPSSLSQRAATADRDGTARGVVLTLLTPAIFAGGWRPGWLSADGIGSPPGCPDVRLVLRAAAVERWVPVSGWDLATERPKAMRKAVAAGAVYWFEIAQGTCAQALQALWLQPLSDDEDDRHAGFGLVLAAPWVATAVSSP